MKVDISKLLEDKHSAVLQKEARNINVSNLHSKSLEMINNIITNMAEYITICDHHGVFSLKTIACALLLQNYINSHIR